MASDAFTMLVELIRTNFSPMSDANLSAPELRAGIESVAAVVSPLAGTTVETIVAGGVPC